MDIPGSRKFHHCENISMISNYIMDIPGYRNNILKNSIAVKIHSSAHLDERDYFIRSQWGVVYVTSEGDLFNEIRGSYSFCPRFGHYKVRKTASAKHSMAARNFNNIFFF